MIQWTREFSVHDGLFSLHCLLVSYDQVSDVFLDLRSQKPNRPKVGGGQGGVVYNSVILLVLVRGSLPHHCLSCHFLYQWVCCGIWAQELGQLSLLQSLLLGRAPVKTDSLIDYPGLDQRANTCKYEAFQLFSFLSGEGTRVTNFSLFRWNYRNHQCGKFLNFHGFDLHPLVYMSYNGVLSTCYFLFTRFS